MITKKHVFMRVSWKNLVISSLLSTPISIAAYFWFIQPANFISKRYIAAAILLWIVFAVGILCLLRHFKHKIDSIGQRIFYITMLLCLIIASLIGIFAVGIENTPYNLFFLPKHSLVIENANENENEVIELIYFDSGLEDESLSKFIIDGNWARTENSLTAQGTQKGSLIFEGWLVENPALSFQEHPNGGQVNIYWDGQLEQVRFSSYESNKRHVTNTNTIEIPIFNRLPILIAGISSIAIFLFPLMLELVKIANVQSKESISREIVSHFRLLSIKKKDVLSYLSSPYRIILIIIFTVLFLPHVFVVVKDINFVTAYEVDPGSVIRSIIRLYDITYNMNETSHARYYGWTYFSINFFLLIPVYALTALKIIPTDYYFFVSIRYIFFLIGLASVLAFFEVAKRTLKHNFLSFIAAMLYIASPITFRFFYFLHPETTGLLFLFLSILCLTHFNEGKAEDYRWYTFGLFSLVLSTLSKHVFLITALPVLFLYVYFYCHHHKKSIFRFLVSKQFAMVLLASIGFSILIFFIINPYAFIKPERFLTNQRNLFFSHAGAGSPLTRLEAIKAWINIIKSIPIIYLTIISLPFTILGAVIFGRDQETGKMLYIVNILTSVLFITIMSITSRFIIYNAYFAPIYPFFILNLISVPLYIIRKWNAKRPIKLLSQLALICFLFVVLVGDFSDSIPMGYARFMYQDSVIYKAYKYIEENIPNGSKVSYDAYVAIPSGKEITACLFWDKCAEDIEEFQPDFVLFYEEYTFNGEYPATERLNNYVNDHHYVLIDIIETVSVWKKPSD